MTTLPTVLVTGASRGIGQAICQHLLNTNHRVIGIARQLTDSSLLDHPHFEFVPLDLGDLEALPPALKPLAKRYSTLSAVICNAGQGQFKHLEEFSFDQIRDLMHLNFLSHVYLTKAFLPLLKQQPKSDLIFIGSEAALTGKRQGSIYCASKFALRGFTQALREECATSPVRVCLINPGMVQTSFFDDLSFSPGTESHAHLQPHDIAQAVHLVLQAREGTVFDEINLSPHKKRICFKKKENS